MKFGLPMFRPLSGRRWTRPDFGSCSNPCNWSSRRDRRQWHWPRSGVSSAPTSHRGRQSGRRGCAAKQTLTGPIAPRARSARPLSPAWKLLLRTAIPAACLATVLLLAQNAEADWTGLFGTFSCTMLAVLVVTKLEAGPGAAVELLRTYPIGKCSTLAFLAAFALLTPALGPVAGYVVGYLAAGCVLAGLARSARSVTRAEPALS